MNLQTNIFGRYFTLTDKFTDGLNPSVFDSSCHNDRRMYKQIYSIGITDSPKNLPTDLIRRYFTVPATTTDEFTDGDLRSVFQTFTDNFTDDFNPSVCHTITDGLKSVGIFQAGNIFFGAQFPSVKPSANFFYVSDRYSDGQWYYR